MGHSSQVLSYTFRSWAASGAAGSGATRLLMPPNAISSGASTSAPQPSAFFSLQHACSNSLHLFLRGVFTAAPHAASITSMTATAAAAGAGHMPAALCRLILRRAGGEGGILSLCSRPHGPPSAHLPLRYGTTTSFPSISSAPSAALRRPLLPLQPRSNNSNSGSFNVLGWVRRMASSGAAGQQSAATPAARLGPRRGGHLREAAQLQLAALWQSYGTAVYGTTALLSVFLLWRLMRSVSGAFIAVNDKLAEYGLLALSASMVLLGGLYGRWHVSVSPGAVYRQALLRLNTHPGVLEVMGAPLVGSPVRAYVVTGGGLYLSKRLRVKLRARRITMIFPLSGRDRKGLVSLEAKRKGGQYMWKLLAVDLGPELQGALPARGAPVLSAAPPPPPAPTASDSAVTLTGAGSSGRGVGVGAQRVYVVGDVAAYQRGGVLAELRTPFQHALNNSRSYEVEDELEDELAELEVPKPPAAAAAAAAASAAATAAKSAVHRARSALTQVASQLSKQPAALPAEPEAAAAAAAAAKQQSAAPAPASASSSPVAARSEGLQEAKGGKEARTKEAARSGWAAWWSGRAVGTQGKAGAEGREKR